MKTIKLLLFIALPILAQSQENRIVINTTVELWKQNYSTVIEDLSISKYESERVFSRDLYQQYFQNDNYTSERINFWYYLDSDSVLRIAIQTGDTTYLTHDRNAWHETSASDMADLFQAWNTFAASDTNAIVYVEQYRFYKSYVDELFETATSIKIEDVVHTVSPNTDRYDLPEYYRGIPTTTLEGLLAFDILIFAVNEGMEIIRSEGDSHYSNFAKPCPKLCD